MASEMAKKIEMSELFAELEHEYELYQNESDWYYKGQKEAQWKAAARFLEAVTGCEIIEMDGILNVIFKVL